MRWDDVHEVQIAGKKSEPQRPLLDTLIFILGVLENRKKITVKTFLSGMPRKLRKTIKAVCSDMYDGFIHAAQEVFGKRVKIVIDRFHVAKLYRKGLDTLRKHELQPPGSPKFGGKSQIALSSGHE